MSARTEDLRWMRRALSLARRAEGQTRPNPPVGAVIVEDGAPLGEGWHHAAGLPHAEVNAFSSCPRKPSPSATLYVTLEPCCTTGRTPPCTDLIIRSGIRRVVAACPDPNPKHAGRGLEILRAAGIDVSIGPCRAEAESLIEPFVTRTLLGRPFFSLKLAMTLDGRIADREGSSRWVTGERSRAWCQRLRRRCDAMMVGAGTVIADDPSLLCRLPGAPDTLFRVIVDGGCRIPPAAQVLTDSAASRTIVVTAIEPTARQLRALTAHGARVWTLPAPASAAASPLAPALSVERPAASPFAPALSVERPSASPLACKAFTALHDHPSIDLPALSRLLAGEGFMHVLCEGGGVLAGSLVRAGLVDEFLLFYAPKLLGDPAARPGLDGLGLLMADSLALETRSVRMIGGDLLVTARRAKGG